MKTTSYKAAALGLLFSVAVANAFAEYIWLDEKGVKQYSDRAPASSVPDSKILKRPGNAEAQPAAAPASSENADATAAANKSAAPLSAAEKNAEFNKRQMERAAADKKIADEAKVKADRAKNCDRARDYKRSLDGGERIARPDKSGERNFLSDEQRAQESRDTQRVLNDCK